MSGAQATHKVRVWGGLAALAFLVACDALVSVDSTQTTDAQTAALALPAEPAVQATSERSAALRRYLNEVQSLQLTSGLLRQDGGGPDTPFSADMLARNFEQIVFFNEYSSNGLPRGVSGALRRWDEAVRIGVVFGPSVPPSQRMRDRADVRAYATRLSRVTGHPISTTGTPNFLVFFVGEDDRASTLNSTATRLPGVTRTNLEAVRNLPDDAYCAVAAYAAGPNRATYTAAVAVIRAENPDLLRLSCIHEELAQGLGLANDSPEARPSIFNDDDEFALLTNHDEVLLAMLYDARLSTGISLTTAHPIVQNLAREATEGPL